MWAISQIVIVWVDLIFRAFHYLMHYFTWTKLLQLQKQDWTFQEMDLFLRAIF